jgi:biopolymer transport protein TolQ
MGEGLWTMISNAGGMEQAIMLLLAVASVALWSLVFLKVPEMIRARKASEAFMETFKQAGSFAEVKQLKLNGDAVQASCYKAALQALEGRRPAGSMPSSTTEEIVQLSMQHTAAAHFTYLSRGLSFLATTGSTTPFIGLFGTVVGIMSTFQALGAVKTPSMQIVAPGISGALVATAAGLAVAIPAVIAFNWLSHEIDGLSETTDKFIERMMALLRASKEHGTQMALVHTQAIGRVVEVGPNDKKEPAPAASKPDAAEEDDLDDEELSADDNDEDEDEKPAAKPTPKPSAMRPVPAVKVPVTAAKPALAGGAVKRGPAK